MNRLRPSALLAAVLCSAIGAVPRFASAAVVATATGDGWCGVTANSPPNQVPHLVPVQMQTTPLGNGGIEFQMGCGSLDGFSFGAALQQGFAGWAGVNGFGEARPGVIRGYLGVAGLVSPTRYEIGVFATNPYQAKAAGSLVGALTDTFVVPATAAAPNPGDPTTIEVHVHLSCVENANYAVEWDWQTTVGAAVKSADDVPIDGVQLQTVIVSGYPGLHSPCPLDNVAFPKVVNVTVGQTVKIDHYLTISLGMVYARDSSFPSIEGYTDALNTARLAVFSAEHTPLTGESGWVYDDPQNLPTLPTITTTTTTSTTQLLVTTTTLAGCDTTCGNGVVDAACGETCDCPHSDDPVTAAYGCTGAAIVPSQTDCMVCRGCTLDQHICDAALPPTTSTTTTTTLAGATTTTTIPAGCEGQAGAALGRCLLEAALALPLCGDETLPRGTDRALRGKLGGASKQLGAAVSAAGRKQARLLKKARRLLDAADRSSAAAAKRKKKPISTVCADTIGSLVLQVTNTIGN